jgi:hypothetical protein
MARAIRRGRPWRLIGVGDIEDDRARTLAQLNRPSSFGKPFVNPPAHP